MLPNPYSTTRLLTEASVSFPALNEVKEDFSVYSSESFSCASLEGQLAQNGLAAATLHCTQDQHSPPGQGSTNANGGTNSGSASGGLTSAEKAGIGVGVGVGGVVIIVALTLLIRRRRSRKKRGEATPHVEKDGSEVDRAAMLSNDRQRHEMEQRPEELPVGGEAQELPAMHGDAELGRNTSNKAWQGVESRHKMPADGAIHVEDTERTDNPIPPTETDVDSR